MRTQTIGYTGGLATLLLCVGLMFGCGGGVGGLGDISGQITLTAVTTSIPADGRSSVAITASMTDSSGSPVVIGTRVTFTTNLGRFRNGGSTYAVSTTDTTGVVIASLIASTVPGTAIVTCESNGVTQRMQIVLPDRNQPV